MAKNNKATPYFITALVITFGQSWTKISVLLYSTKILTILCIKSRTQRCQKPLLDVIAMTASLLPSEFEVLFLITTR